MGTDRLASAILDFPAGQSVFTCSTQLVPFQTIQIMGTRGRIQIEIPFNAPPDRPTRLFVDNGADLFGGGRRQEEFPVCDQYTIQGDLFSRAIREDGDVPTPLEDSVRNMMVIEAIAQSHGTGHWQAVG
jgi:predicted dehydrogenase